MVGVSLVAELVGELVSPSRCAACDWPVSRRALFCVPCAASALPAPAAPPGSQEALAAFEYGGAVATAIVRLKYEDRADLAPRLGRAMADAARERLGGVDLVVPVPLHPRRLAIRGYNQAALLGAPVARVLGVGFAPCGLVRLRDTPRQATLDRAARLANLDAAFAVRDERFARRARGARVLLVDDVRTTGATLADCGRALLAEGAREVVSLVCAAALVTS